MKKIESQIVKFDLTAELTAGGLAKENAINLLKDYGVPFTEVGKIIDGYDFDEQGQLIANDKAIVVTDEQDNKGMALARATRLELRQHRIAIEKRHDILKQDSLTIGRAIDLVQRVALAKIAPVEAHLQLQEDYAMLKNQARMDANIAKRKELLEPYNVDTSIYNFGDMSEEAFEKILAGAKKDLEDTVAREEAEKKAIAERERLVEEARQKEIADAKEAQLKAEAEAEKLRAEQKIANDKAEAEAKILRDNAAKATSELAQARAEKEEADKLEAERLASIEADRLEEERKLAEAEKAKQSAPDKDKMNEWLSSIAGTLPVLTTERGKELTRKITAHFAKTIAVYKNLIDTEL